MKHRKSLTLLLSGSVITLLALFLLRIDWAQASAPAAAAQARPAYVRVTDEWEFSSIEVPGAWSDIDTGPWIVNGVEIGVFIEAAPNLEEFETGMGSGVFFGLTKEGIPAQPVSEEPEAAVQKITAAKLEQNAKRYNACSRQGVQRHNDLHVTGSFDVASNCRADRGRTQAWLLDAMPLSQNYRVSLRIVTNPGQERSAVARMLSTFQVLNPSMTRLHDGDH